jgi:hypothetical protein
MIQKEITIIYAQRTNITNEKTGVVTELTKIVYAVKMNNNENIVGNAVLENYKVGNLLEKIKPFVMKNVNAVIEEKATKNGSKYVIQKLNNVEI